MNLLTFDGKRVVVWGGGIEGRGAQRWFEGRHCDVAIITDDTPDLHAALASADVIIRSPGVNPRRPELAGRPVTTLTDLWLATPRSAPVIGVTGTKGKSTTTVITTRLLESHGLRVGMGGNIEIPVTDLPPDCDAYVIEVSSYMASDLSHSPEFGVLTNLGDDHLVWHGGVEEYRRDKLRLFAHPQLQRLAVNGLDTGSVEATASLPTSLFGTAGYTRSGTVVAHDGAVVADLAGTNLGNAHFALNACGALTAAQWVAGERLDRHLGSVAAAYIPLASRLERIAERDGLMFIDDALASNPTGAQASVTAFDGEPLALIVGGADRNVEFESFFAWLAERPAPTTLVLISDIAADLARLADHHSLRHQVVIGDDFDTAVGLAVDALSAGGNATGVVLFSPAAATPAAVGNYKQRSERFRRAVRGQLTGIAPSV